MQSGDYKAPVLLTGYARLPDSTTAGAIYTNLGIGLEIDPKTHIIEDANATMASDLGRNFITGALIGHCLKEGVDGPVRYVQRHYFGKAKKAIIAAIQDAYTQYLEFVDAWEKEDRVTPLQAERARRPERKA